MTITMNVYSSWDIQLKLALIFLLVTVFNTSLAVKFKCSNPDEFYFSKPGTHCTKFYKCTTRGHKEVRECGAGSMFDFYSQSCTRNSGVCYEPLCTGRTNGVYQDTTHACRRAFTCHSGKLVNIDNCPPSHLHNGRKCVNQDLVMCELPHTTAVGYPFSGDRRCSGRADGSYGVDDCSAYLICRNQEVADSKSCPEGYRFKDELQQCVPANQVPYCSASGHTSEHACRHKRDGAHFDPNSDDCKSFLVCRGGNLMTRETCSSDSVFNGEVCVPSPLYTCPSDTWSPQNDICRKKSNGFYSNPMQGCSSYVRCMSSRTVEVYDCPSGQYFDAEENNCIFEKLAEKRKCTPAVKSAECNNKAQGFYQGPSCHTYYYCFNGFKTEYKCSQGRVFDGEKCVSKSSYSCPLDDQSSCASKPDGYYPDYQAGCRSYYYCSTGNKITYLCEVGHIFDGSRCVANSHGHRCNPDSICKRKSDGYHADVGSNCRNYVYCKNGEKYTQLTCRGSNIFNGEKCVSPGSYACPSHQNRRQLNCMPKRCTVDCQTDGFYPDIDSGCKHYFFCIGGKRSSLACSAGQIFNGEVCVPQDKFSCPVYCDQSTSNSVSCSLRGF